MRHAITTLIPRTTIRYRPRVRQQPRTAILAQTTRAYPLNTPAASNMSSASASASATAAEPGANPSPSPSSEPKLPPLSASEFREYNRMAEHMDMFHSHFRSTWNILYTSASSGRRAQGLSIRAFIATGLQFVSQLEMHHSIEERYVFPELATRMPEFRTGRERNLPPDDANMSKEEGEGKKKAAELLQQHVEIHKGMDGLQDYLRRCLSGETELQMGVLKEQLDTWGTVLWTHLDQEVRTLGAENMRRYWSLDEVRKMRM
ncbi:hypothetical protein F4678DRAFT_416082 [Xylaria arbuscula]|nr:hypothetical protein F4678DRAFT_416082 [Xylaria arbuscula]